MTRYSPLLLASHIKHHFLDNLVSQCIVDAFTPNGRASGTIDLYLYSLANVTIHINANKGN